MKHYLLLIAASFIAYFINIGIGIFWHFSVIEGVIFTSHNNWFPYLEISLQPPVFIFYFFFGWLYSRLFGESTLVSAIRLAALVLMWRVFFIEIIWYIEPSFAEQTWKTFFNLVPSLATVIGWFFANKSLKSGTPQSGSP
jgi:hypothetical protein